MEFLFRVHNRSTFTDVRKAHRSPPISLLEGEVRRRNIEDEAPVLARDGTRNWRVASPLKPTILPAQRSIQEM